MPMSSSSKAFGSRRFPNDVCVDEPLLPLSIFFQRGFLFVLEVSVIGLGFARLFGGDLFEADSLAVSMKASSG